VSPSSLFDCSSNPSCQDTLVYIKSFPGVSLSAGHVLFVANSNLTYSGMCLIVI
jgi:hypothetical protein